MSTHLNDTNTWPVWREQNVLNSPRVIQTSSERYEYEYGGLAIVAMSDGFFDIYYTVRYAAIRDRRLQISYLRSIHSWMLSCIPAHSTQNPITMLHLSHSATVGVLSFCLFQVMRSKVGMVMKHGLYAAVWYMLQLTIEAVQSRWASRSTWPYSFTSNAGFALQLTRIHAHALKCCV